MSVHFAGSFSALKGREAAMPGTLSKKMNRATPNTASILTTCLDVLTGFHLVAAAMAQSDGSQTIRAVKFIERNAAAKKPFYVISYISTCPLITVPVCCRLLRTGIDRIKEQQHAAVALHNRANHPQAERN